MQKIGIAGTHAKKDSQNTHSGFCNYGAANTKRKL